MESVIKDLINYEIIIKKAEILHKMYELYTDTCKIASYALNYINKMIS